MKTAIFHKMLMKQWVKKEVKYNKSKTVIKRPEELQFNNNV
jgi:hypothetical protein